MIEKLKQPPVLIGLAILLIAVVVILTFGNTSGSREDKPDKQMKAESASQSVSDLKVAKKATDHVHDINDTANGNAASANETAADKVPRHQDMLSEEMKQAIRDKLLFHGPMEVITHPDGRIELPSNGRFTQMPVAVEMPDGTIQIKEYSSLPD
ncbi:hypothetical protein A9R00_01695 [Oleispira antarctica]|uniref:Uncharacterized protein n=1 Tax=Oleispira antarctica TaxID=188908 RepID=A0A1Y5HVF6_OLEAN|nr:hypothetical protein A9R00_01695 [Oleispira antarctica]